MANPKLGYVKIWRDIEFNELWNDGKPFSQGQAFIQLVLWAEYQEEKVIVGNQLITLRVGEFIKSQREMAESMNWSQSTLNRWLKKLVKMNQIRINNESKQTRVSLINYEDRQINITGLNRKVNQKMKNSGGANYNNYSNYNNYNNNNINKINKASFSKTIYKKNKNDSFDKPTNDSFGVVQGKSFMKKGKCESCKYESLMDFVYGANAECPKCKEFKGITMEEYNVKYEKSSERQKRQEEQAMRRRATERGSALIQGILSKSTQSR